MYSFKEILFLIFGKILFFFFFIRENSCETFKDKILQTNKILK